MTDAVIIGGGHNGLVAANMLADHGWSVVVLEAQPTAGGGVRSAELIEPGYVNDRCSAFYPLSVASPAMGALHLEQFGLRWLRSEVVIAHPAEDGSCPAIARTPNDTAATLVGGDKQAWRALFEEWQSVGDHVTNALLGAAFPPARALTRLAIARRRPPLLELARLAVLPVRRLADERFTNAATQRLLAGLALHADLPPEAPLSGFFGWLLAGLAQEHGFPVPAGGAQRITDALVERLHSRGGRVLCNEPGAQIAVRNGRAVAVRTRAGREYEAERAVLADVDAPQLYLQLLPDAAVPARVRERIAAFSWDNATFKVDWNLDGPIPWDAAAARKAGTVHIAESVDELTFNAASLAAHRIPATPFLICGQQSMTDASRQPEGKETAWAYTHVPQHVCTDDGPDALTGRWSTDESARFADRVERRVETLAPGFRALIRGRHITAPPDFTQENASMPRGALNLGTAQLHQQLVFRPMPGWGRSETPVRGLFLASGSAHPGGGVHGACGANAARAAVLHDRAARWRRRG